MNGIAQLLAVARAYAEIEGVALSVVSSRVFDDSKRLGVIECGADMKVKRLERAMQWFSDNWPGDDWPDGIPRPAPSLSEGAHP